ncbi:hypothetical protein AZF04_13735 [Alkalihalobacillus trypoxylicola]|uniref:VWFA domain-containing protein n=1 Tax=Alkalihalobacillus trypoxylicola TaxID=519424 RepID=A0A161PVH3_9BACI|nr:hypothetical protein AZF04_13735 [Alkalihalobacillus trypoxylicola]
MGVLAPYFGAMSIFLVGLVALYMFRKQYEERYVASHLFWREALKEYQASKWWHKLQKHLLFFLQFMILLSLIIALIRPFFYSEQSLQGQHLIMVLDTSASMEAEVEDGITRFEEAQKQMLQLLEEKSNTQRVSIMTVGENPQLLVSQENDYSILEKEILDVEILYSEANFERALSLVEALSVEEETTVHIYSDQLQQEIVEQSLSSVTNVYNIGNEQPFMNVGISSFVINHEQSHAFIQLNQEGMEEQQVDYQLTIDGEVFLEDSFVLDNEPHSFIYLEDLPAGDTYQIELIENDDYKLDNIATSFSQPSESPVIYVIGESSPFLSLLLEQISEEIIFANTYSDITEWEDHSIIISFSDENFIPEKPTLFMAQDAGTPLQFNEKVPLTERPVQFDGESLLQFTDFSQVFILEAWNVEENSLDVLVQANDIPLISKGYIENQPVLAVHFELEQSDWPLHSDFPIFFYQAVEELSGNERSLGYFAPLEQRPLPLPEKGLYQVIDEDNQIIDEIGDDESIFVAPSKPGLYRLRHMETNEISYLSVYLPESEQFVKAFESFMVGNGEAPQEGHFTYKNEFWKIFVLLAFLVLLVEWEVFRREL